MLSSDRLHPGLLGLGASVVLREGGGDSRNLFAMRLSSPSEASGLTSSALSEQQAIASPQTLFKTSSFWV